MREACARLRCHDLPGDGIPIVFLHGLGCASSFDYPQVANNLSGHRRILVDLLGSGFSDKPENFGYTMDDHAEYIAHFIDEIGLRECILYAHSMGGAIAISLAKRMGGALKGMVISEGNLDPGGGFYSRKIASYSEAGYCSSGHDAIIRDSLAEASNNWAASLSVSYPAAIHREAVSLVRGCNPSWREQLYALAIPVTWIFGEHSLPDHDLEILESKGINIEIVKGVGHSMAWENPLELSLAIGRCIARYR